MEPLQFGNYTLIERISHGGMAEVFRAKSFGEAGFEREVALKVLLPNVASDEDFITMLIDEAKIAGQLNHTNIAQIFDLGVTEGRYYIVQEFVRGKDLRAILQHKAKTRTHFEIATACYIALKICEGLHYAHNKRDPLGNPLRVVHRDISPHNILISNEGEVKIVDFGIAKAEGRSTKTLAGLVKGKFAYMSPEQIRGLPVDHRSDIFATGIVLHKMLTSRALFRSATEFETLKRAREAKADPPSYLRAEVPAALDAIVLKSLARHVHDRYQSADEFRNALWTFARDHDAYAGGNIVSDLWKEPEEQTNEHDTNVASELAYEVSAVEDIIETSPIAIAGLSGLASEIVDRPDDSPVDHDFENSTIVDSGPFGTITEEDLDDDHDDGEMYTPTDHDAQWAADLGPLQIGVPNRSLRPPTNDELSQVQTDEYGQNDQALFDEQTSENIARIVTRDPLGVTDVGAQVSDLETRPTAQFAAQSILANESKPGVALAHADTDAVPADAILRPPQTFVQNELPNASPVGRRSESKPVAHVPAQPATNMAFQENHRPALSAPGSSSGPLPLPTLPVLPQVSAPLLTPSARDMRLPELPVNRAPTAPLPFQHPGDSARMLALSEPADPIQSVPPQIHKGRRTYFLVAATLFLLLAVLATVTLLIRE